jgi:Flp pilus assembly protein TadB
MKDLNDKELLDLAYEEIRKMDIHIISTIIFVILLVAEIILALLQIISATTYFIVILVVLVLYYYHDQKYKKCEKRIEEILKELNSREL